MDLQSILRVLGIPTNARAYIKGVSGDQAPVNETYFNPAELDALRFAVLNGLMEYSKPLQPKESEAYPLWIPDPDRPGSQMANLEAMDQFRKQYPRDQYRQYANPNISYEEYQRPWIFDGPANIFGWFRDPGTIAQSTVGGATIGRDENGNAVLLDNYDFDKGRKFNTSTIWGKLHSLGEDVVPPGSGYPMNINLGSPKDWDRTEAPIGFDLDTVVNSLQSIKPEKKEPEYAPR